nr:Gfo/Idh/MocA family oxidoreductase [Catelliglobosispora koreensis]
MRAAIVGTGARAQMWAHELRQHGDLVALADTNPARLAAFQRLIAGNRSQPAPAGEAVSGHAAPASWVIAQSADVARMLAAERADVLVVCSPDATHDEHIVAGLDAGAHVITEKPMTTDAAKARRILDAQKRTAGLVTVAFNYRYHPVYAQVKQVLPRIGEISSVHFEWLLDVRHGADYFRRWHRDKAQSGGLLVHKATHHFDLINWWLGTTPEQVSAQGKLFFYGEAGRRHGYDRGYARAHGTAEAVGDPFALSLQDNPAMKALYLDAEEHDGYQRDLNVFAPGVSIEDDLAVLVRYASGATMSYHLTAFSPWEGLRIAFNGSQGRLELDLTESDHVAPGVSGAVKGHSAALHGAEAAAEQGGVSLRLRHFWQPPQDLPVATYEKTGHGGADSRMVAAIFSAASAPTATDGAWALLTGLAANESMRTQRSVRASDLLDLTEWES